MRIDILTVMPDALESPLHTSILQRAQDKGLVEIHVHNLRDWSLRKHRKVDDYPFGGEAGMVMQIEPVWRCMEELKSQRHYDEIIFTSPDGEQLDQPMANALSLKGESDDTVRPLQGRGLSHPRAPHHPGNHHR